MPLLRFGKERLDPHLPFAHRLLVGLGGVVAADLVEILLVQGPVHDPAVVTGGALGLDGTGVASRGISAIDDLVFGVLGLPTWQELSLRTAIAILVGLVAKRPLAKERRTPIEVRQREEG